MKAGSYHGKQQLDLVFSVSHENEVRFYVNDLMIEFLMKIYQQYQ